MTTIEGDLNVISHPTNTSIYGNGVLTLGQYILLHGSGAANTFTTLSSAQTSNVLLTLPIPSSGSDNILSRQSSDTVTNKIITSTTNTVYAKGLTNATTNVIISASAAPSANQALIATNSTTAAWSSINHTTLTNIGTNTHSDIDVHIANINNPHAVTIDQITPTNNKGELMVENGTNVVALPVSSDGYILTLDSTQSRGLKWAPAATSITFVNWTSWTPISVAGIGSLSNTESKYTRLGNMVTLTFDFGVVTNTNSDTITVRGLPLNIGNFTAGTKLSNMIFIRDVSDSSVNFGQILMDASSSDRFNLTLSSWINGNSYRVRGQINYGTV